MPEDPLTNTTWSPLITEHAHLALGNHLARRYPADILPFAGVPETAAANMAALRDLHALGEPIHIVLPGDTFAPVPGLEHAAEIPCFQMHFHHPPPPPEEATTIRRLSAEDAPAMVHLTDVAFPGLFRPRTCVLGAYFGIERDGELIAMAGERFAVPGTREISAVCTHPAHTGRGYAALLIRHVLRVQAAAGIQSFLHVSQANTRAIALYQRLGFTHTRAIIVHRLRRA